MLTHELGELGLCYSEVRRFERFPNLFAIGVGARIIPARGLMAHEIREACFLPSLRGFALFHRGTVENDRRKHNKNLYSIAVSPIRAPIAQPDRATDF